MVKGNKQRCDVCSVPRPPLLGESMHDAARERARSTLYSVSSVAPEP
jgi:hypothetical protein